VDPNLYRQKRCPHGWVNVAQCEPCATKEHLRRAQDALRELVRVYKVDGAGSTSAAEIAAAWRAANDALLA
jgi:hypothetical protein